ncbi:uncharacterized protein LOC110883259 [Helianthus annuus]|uniref:uncharacterized protein LOC110883259 n=1 Tax=Helianthus annuus TaxID=4232 RepID=UPI000B90725D|nr:uncharacterized protein LOC110883259 [Helianthus annuus]
MGDHIFPFFDNLRGNVSQKALELLVVEWKKLNALRAGGGTCGHQLSTGCGFPCACQMEWWENTGCKIPLAATDKFWTKLDFSTEELNQDDCNIQAEMDNLTQQLHTQPPLVVKSMLSKMKAVLNPSMTDHQLPEVQQDTRGRPTTKVKQQKNKDKQPKSQRNDYTQKPNVRRRRSKKTKEEKNTLPIIDKDFPRLAGHRYKNVIERFKDWLPSSYRRYITHIEDAQPNGNCGFRSIAMGLGYDQKEWKWVRQELLDEMFINRMRWGHILESLDKGCYDNVYRSINWLNVEPAPIACWMWLPYTGLLVVQKFGVIVQHLSNGVCQTYFPMFDGPQVYPNHSILTIAYVEDSHFIMVKLADDSPMPVPNGLWNIYRSMEAMEWETMYMSHIAQGRALLRRGVASVKHSVCNELINVSLYYNLNIL